MHRNTVQLLSVTMTASNGLRQRQIAVAPLSLITVPSPTLMVAHPVLAQPFNFRRRSTS
jgi:hypothetical protein